MSFDKVNENWTILNSIENSIKSKIEKIGQPISEWDLSINRGLLTGFNDAFIIDENTKNRLIEEDPKSAEIIRPILRGKDIKKYSYEFKNLYIIYVPWHFPLTNDENIVGSSIKAERALNEQYPAIYNHLLKYKKELSNRNKSETGIRYEWYALQRWGAKYRDDFFKQKIIYSEIVQTPQFYLDNDKNYFPEATTFIMTGDNLEFVIACLNSKLYSYCFKRFYSGGGLGEHGYRYKKVFLEKLPLPKIQDKEVLQEIKTLVLLIQETFESEKLTNYTNQIDEILFNLAGISEEEKKVINEC